MYRGSLQYLYLQKGNYECLEVACVHFHSKRTDMKQWSNHILKSDTSSGDINEKVDHWLDSFEKFHKKHIIMPTESLNSPLLEEILFITVLSQPGFINQENETRSYLNATIKMSYFNVILRQLILNIDCYTMMIHLDWKIKIVFIITKILRLWRSYRNICYYIICCQKNPSRIIDFIWQIKRIIIPFLIVFLSILLPNTRNMDMSYLSRKTKIFKYDSIHMPLGEISHKETKLRPIRHEKKTDLR